VQMPIAIGLKNYDTRRMERPLTLTVQTSLEKNESAISIGTASVAETRAQCRAMMLVEHSEIKDGHPIEHSLGVSFGPQMPRISMLVRHVSAALNRSVTALTPASDATARSASHQP